MPTNVFDPTQYPDLVNIHDRTADRSGIDRVYFAEDGISQAADLNDAFSIEEKKRRQIGDLIAQDGDRLAGGDIVVNAVAGTVLISAGVLYLRGAPRPVDAATLVDVPMTGDVELGVRVVSMPITAADDDIYYGLVPGTESYGEPGAVRTTMVVTWAYDSDEGDGEFYRYALLRNGQVISQSAPPTLTGVQQQIGVYDYDAHGNYIVRGCETKALGLNGTKRIFSISAGVCNVVGRKVVREADTRFEVEEEPDLATVDLEPHTFSGGGTTVIKVRRPPIAAINSLTVTKERTVTLTKGVTGSTDALPDDGVVSILEVKQGATTYADPTSYTRVGDGVSWSPGGPEPATGSSYTVKYRYFDAVEPDAVTDTTITVSGGVAGSDIFVGYTYKLPRHDRIMIDGNGAISYLKGQPSPETPQPPKEPEDALGLCVVKNSWYGRPAIENNGTRSLSFKRLNFLESRLAQTIDMVLQERLKSDANSRSPGPALGIFTDPFWDDGKRDLGELQDAACFDGTMQLAIDPTIHRVRLPSLGLLDFTETTVVAQNLYTGCEKINPYQNFSPVPPRITVEPASDYWTETESVTLSDITRTFGTGNRTRIRSQVTSETVDESRLPFLRQIPLSVQIDDLGPGEVVDELTFDGINVKPGTLVANAEGVATATIMIPPHVAAGAKAVRAKGAAGLEAATIFRGQGRLETTISQTTTVLERFSEVVVRGPGVRDNGRSDNSDPQAQSFLLTEGRFISSIAVRFCRIGNRSNPVTLEIVRMENGFPTRAVVGTARLTMLGVVANTWTRIPLEHPVYIPPNTYVAYVLKTDDGVHSISVATLGEFDAANQRWVAAQPYVTGDRFSGSNGESWYLHPASDITFRGNACLFAPTQKIIAVGAFSATGVTDVLIRSDIILPEASCSVVFRVKMGAVTYTVAADQTLELSQAYTGTVTISAVLTGDARVSPVLSRDITVIFGKLRSTGRYVGLPFSMGDPSRVDIIFSGMIPAGSSVTVRADATDDSWVDATLVSAVPIDDGFTEYTYRIPAHSAPDGGRLELQLAGTPAARPVISDLRAFTF